MLAANPQVKSYIVESLNGDSDKTLRNVQGNFNEARRVAHQLYWTLQDAASDARRRPIMAALHQHASGRHDEVRVSALAEAAQLVVAQMLTARQQRSVRG